MKRAFAVVLLIVAAGSMSAQSQVAEKKSTSPFPQPEGVTPIRLTLEPAAAPLPALKYRLLPEVRELKPGNAVMLYYRAFSPEWQVNRREIISVLDAWKEDTRKVPPDDLRWVLTSPALKEIDEGARRAYVDWEMIERLRRDGISVLLPDTQSFRTYVSLLAARSRLQSADGHFDQAVFTQQTGLKFGRDIAHAPTLIQALVGIAIVNIMLEQTEETIQSPGSPNLYWALTNLPHPMVDLQTPLQGERLFIDNFFPGMREILANKNAKPLPDDQVRLFADNLISSWRMALGGTESDLEVRLVMAGLAARTYPEARRFLLAQGRSKEQVDAMSVLQAATLFEVANYDRYYDEFIKWCSLPYPQARKGVVEAETVFRQARVNSKPGTILASLLLPAMFKIHQASIRADRRIAALRVVEALRLHAAAHGGKFPSSLQDITEVPIPRDPMTDAAFLYHVENDRATLLAPAPVETPGGHNVLMYELRLASKDRKTPRAR